MVLIYFATSGSGQLAVINGATNCSLFQKKKNA